MKRFKQFNSLDPHSRRLILSKKMKKLVEKDEFLNAINLVSKYPEINIFPEIFNSWNDQFFLKYFKDFKKDNIILEWEMILILNKVFQKEYILQLNENFLKNTKFDINIFNQSENSLNFYQYFPMSKKIIKAFIEIINKYFNKNSNHKAYEFLKKKFGYYELYTKYEINVSLTMLFFTIRNMN